MRLKSALRVVAPISLAAALLGGCVLIPDDDAICDDQSPTSGSWPYCAPSDPGGPGPVDDPIDPRGG
jgi:hypothetical protein